MSNHRSEQGKRGEEIALAYLRDKGYTIMETNFRAGHSEIDLICKDDRILVFVEVRSFNSSRHGFPEQSLSQNKINSILRGAEVYIFRNKWKAGIRFDIISILFYPKLELEHFEDAFY